ILHSFPTRRSSDLSHNLNGWALIPTDDHTVALVSNHHEALSAKYHVTVPGWETLQWASDKRLLHQLAQRLQVHQPWTFCPSTREALANIDCPCPVILKPAIRMQPRSLAVPNAPVAYERVWPLTRC